VTHAFDPLTGAFHGSHPDRHGAGNDPGALRGRMFDSGAAGGGDVVAAVPEPEIIMPLRGGHAEMSWRRRRN
jgi:hypothetical protein